MPCLALCSCLSHAASLKYLANSINLEAESLFFLLDQRDSFYKLKAQRESRCFRSSWAWKADAAQTPGFVGPSHSLALGHHTPSPGSTLLWRDMWFSPCQMCVPLAISLWLIPLTGILQTPHRNPCRAVKPLGSKEEMIKINFFWPCNIRLKNLL